MNNKQHKINSIYTKMCYNELKFFFKRINAFSYAIIKGEPLSYLSYNAFGKRFSSDIDILIQRKDLKEFVSILKEFDFISKIINREENILILSNSHQYLPMHKISNIVRINIDINFDIFWGEYSGKRLDMKEFLDDVIFMNVHGCVVKTLSPLKAMIQLILHHYKEMNSIYHLAHHNTINIHMFNDVYYLLKNNATVINVIDFYNICLEYNIIPYAYYILYYTNKIFQDSFLNIYVRKFKTFEGVELLNTYGLSNKEKKLWKYDFNTRLYTENMYDLIKNDLTQDDINKLKYNQKLFG